MDRFQRAALARQIDDHLQDIAREVERRLPKNETPSSSRLNGILASLDWHQDRQTPAKRVDSLASEVNRLFDSVTERTPNNREELALYAYLDNAVGRGRTENADRNRILGNLRGSGFTGDDLEAELDLRLAQETLSVVQILMRGRLVGEVIAHHQGAFPWQR
jgi:hypothetical protein